MNKYYLLFLVFISTTLWAQSECTFHLNTEMVYYEGYPFRVGDELRKIMKLKNYEEKYPGEVRLEVKVKTIEGRFFQHAQSTLNVVADQTQEVVAQAQGQNRCLTQLCSVWDVQKSLQTALKDLSAQIPDCR